MLENQKPSTPVLIKDLGMLYPTEKSKQPRRFGLYKCQCGNEFKTHTSHIKGGGTRSCGCHQKNMAHRTHGLRYHPLYTVFVSMKSRCFNKNNIRYNSYGGRGIEICSEWKDSFQSFYDWALSNGYKKGLKIDRINNDGNYEPSNCRWATNEVQGRNTRRIMSTNTSGYRGVSKNGNGYISRIIISCKSKYLGYFSTALEAAKAYDTYVIKNNLEHTINMVL